MLNDVVGALVAALAMTVAVFGLWVGYRLAKYQLDIKFALITIVFYSIKDRIKVTPPPPPQPPPPAGHRFVLTTVVLYVIKDGKKSRPLFLFFSTGAVPQ